LGKNFSDDVPHLEFPKKSKLNIQKGSLRGRKLDSFTQLHNSPENADIEERNDV
jgi:hypothetical protein